MSRDTLKELVHVSKRISERQWSPATGGNFSARVSPATFVITRSGVEKSALTEENFLECSLNGKPLETGEVPSAETPVHAALYTLDEQIGAVLHTHSVPATVLSMQHASEDALTFTGYEMVKSISGMTSHEETLSLPLIDNTQDMAGLGDWLTKNWTHFAVPFGFILCGHGLYAWGKDVAEAYRHVEGFEFLLECELSKT